MHKFNHKSAARSVKVKVVKPDQQIANLQGGNVVDTRAKTKRGFGRMFFVSIKKVPKTERDNWQKLERGLNKRIKD